jgi:hypothetical protein
MGTVFVLVFWYSLDTYFPRRSLYAFFGRLEGTLKHGLRFWRRVATLATAIGGLGLALVQYTETSASEPGLSPTTAQSIVALAVAFLASFGWMYTRFEQEKSDRAKATLEAIRDQMYGQRIADSYRAITLMSGYCVNKLGTPRDRPFNDKELAVRLEWVAKDVSSGSLASMSHADAADQFINSLNQMAFGVRNGQLDLDTIALVLRPRMIRVAFRYHLLICQSTKAELDERLGRMRAKKRTWEHFLWLTTKMDVLKSDGISFESICLPPDHIIGTKPDELADQPRLRTGGPFSVNWDLIDSGMRKLANGGNAFHDVPPI